MKKIISLVLTLGIMVGIFSVSASAASITSEFSGTQNIEKGKTVSLYFTSSAQPIVVTGTNSVAVVKPWYTSGNKYYYRLTMVGNPGTGTGVYARIKGSANVLAFIAQVPKNQAPATTNKSGTVNVASGDAFNFVVTSAAKPNVGTGNSNIATADYLSNSGTAYNYMLSAKSGVTGGVGVYVNGNRAFIANVTASSDNGGASSQSLADYRTALINLINAERAKVGVSALTEDSRLNQVADIRAKEASVSYQHGRPNGESWQSLWDIAGINYSMSDELAIAGNTNTAAEAFNNYMTEPAHKDALLMQSNVNIGVSFYDVDGNRFCAVEMTQG